MSQLHRVLHMPEYALLRLDMPGYGYASDICLDMFKYAEICVNMPKSTWMVFLYFPIVIPCLTERALSYFSVYTKVDVLV